jgi:hypothetical protein
VIFRVELIRKAKTMRAQFRITKNISLRGTHVGSTWFVVYLKGRHIGTLLPKKVPKQKTCPILRKWVINDYPL